MNDTLLLELTVITACLAAGGVLKGATGAGAPILAVPAIAAFFDVRFAVIVMLAPNLLTNAWQAWRFRRQLPEPALMTPLLVGGAVGIVAGTIGLRVLPSDTLSLAVAIAVFAYVALRLARPDWSLSLAHAKRIALPTGLIAGILQGAAGISAPVSITFLSAIRLGREGFIAAISTFFVAFTAVQVFVLWINGLIRPGEVWISLAALLPITLAMPLGAAIARRVSPVRLEQLILVVLLGLAIKLLLEAAGSAL